MAGEPVRLPAAQGRKHGKLRFGKAFSDSAQVGWHAATRARLMAVETEGFDAGFAGLLKQRSRNSYFLFALSGGLASASHLRGRASSMVKKRFSVSACC